MLTAVVQIHNVESVYLYGMRSEDTIMKILHQLDRPNFRASKSDKILLQYIKEHADLFCTTPIAALALNCGVSEATITRFVRKMGFTSLQFFKLTLNEELADSKKYLIVNRDISCDESIDTTAPKLLAHNIAALENTATNLNGESLKEVVRIFQRSKKIFFIGLGSSGFIAADTAYKFMRIGINAEGLNNIHMIMLQMALLESDDAVVAVSHSGESVAIARALCLAKENNAKTILITSNRQASLANFADICIFYETTEPILKVETASPKVAQVFILELIYTQIIKETVDMASVFKKRTTDAINVLNMLHLEKKE